MIIAEELINFSIPHLTEVDTSQKALSWMEDFRLIQLPYIEDGRFMGLISDDMLFESLTNEREIRELPTFGKDSFVFKDQHIFEVFKKSDESGTEIIAVLDDSEKYMGAITTYEIVGCFSHLASIRNQGGIIVLSMREMDYSLSELSRLIEAENAKIIGCYINDDESDPNRIEVTLKVNKPDLQHIIATLERFDYDVKAKFQKKVSMTNEQERIDHFMKFINI